MLGSAAPAEEVLSRTKPWGALLRVTAAQRAGDAPTLDRSLWALARERRLAIIGLETIEEQVAAFDSIPLETQIALLRHAIEHRADLEAQTEPTVRAWLRGDLAALARLGTAAAGDDPALRDHYAVLAQQLVVNRSALMAYRLFLPLRRGGVFVAVGALHLLGEEACSPNCGTRAIACAASTDPRRGPAAAAGFPGAGEIADNAAAAHAPPPP